MIRFQTSLLATIHVISLIGYSIITVQAQPIPLQHIIFKDSVVADRLTAFFIDQDAQATFLNIHKLQDTYVCTIDELFYVEQIEHLRSLTWAEWQGRIVLIQSDQVYTSPNKVGQYSIFRPLADPDQFYTLTDRTVSTNLVNYARCIMPKEFVHPAPIYKSIKGKKGYNRDDPPPPNIIEGPTEMFEVVNGRAIDVYDIISPLAPPDNAFQKRPLPPKPVKK